MKLTYKGAGELAVLYIDRSKKKLLVASSKTGYKRIETEWSKLFDPGKEKKQEEYTDQLDDDGFVKEITRAMNGIGYRLTADDRCWNSS